MENKNDQEFEDKEEALDFLLTELSDKRQKEAWAQSLGGNPAAKKKTIGFILKGIAILALLLTAVMVYNYTTTANNEKDPILYAETMIESSSLEWGSNTRSVTADDGSRLPLLEAYEQKNYEKVLEIYQSDKLVLTTNDKYNYALLLAKDDVQNKDRVITLCAGLIESKTEFAADALWLRAAVYIKTNELVKAKEDLKNLKAYQYKSKRVEEILHTLK